MPVLSPLSTFNHEFHCPTYSKTLLFTSPNFYLYMCVCIYTYFHTFFTLILFINAGTYHIGVVYGAHYGKLTTPEDVMRLYRRCGIEFIRQLEPDLQVLKALRGSNLQPCLGVRNQDLQNISLSQSAATQWVQTYVLPYKNQVSFGWITLGNEATPGPNAKYVACAMNNMRIVLNSGPS